MWCVWCIPTKTKLRFGSLAPFLSAFTSPLLTKLSNKLVFLSVLLAAAALRNTETIVFVTAVPTITVACGCRTVSQQSLPLSLYIYIYTKSAASSKLADLGFNRLNKLNKLFTISASFFSCKNTKHLPVTAAQMWQFHRMMRRFSLFYIAVNH